MCIVHCITEDACRLSMLSEVISQACFSCDSRLLLVAPLFVRLLRLVNFDGPLNLGLLDLCS